MIHDDQKLKEPIEEILSGIADFSAAVDARIDSEDWTPSHIESLHLLRKDLLDMKIRLIKARTETY